jgi:hypothetical protein
LIIKNSPRVLANTIKEGECEKFNMSTYKTNQKLENVDTDGEKIKRQNKVRK